MYAIKKRWQFASFDPHSQVAYYYDVVSTDCGRFIGCYSTESYEEAEFMVNETCNGQISLLQAVDVHDMMDFLHDNIHDGRLKISDLPQDLFDAVFRAFDLPVICECGGDAAKTTHSHWCPVYV